ncbi:hypothetical protein JCM12141A_54790 [Mycolicibacterium hodleri]
MTAATARPELVAIGRLLGVEVDELHGLDGVSDDDLSVLHGQIARRLSADKRRRFARVAALSQSIPGPIAGRLAEKFLPPAGGALVAELLEPAKARDLVGRVSVSYLGDLAIALDPVRAHDVVRAIPAARVGEVAQELFSRAEYAAMARFVGAVEVDALFATLGVATPHDLLAVVPLLTWNDNLDRVIAELPRPPDPADCRRSRRRRTRRAGTRARPTPVRTHRRGRAGCHGRRHRERPARGWRIRGDGRICWCHHPRDALGRGRPGDRRPARRRVVRGGVR